MQRFRQAIAIAATATFVMISPWLPGSADFGTAPAHALGGGGGGGAGGGGGGGAGGGGGGGAGGGGAGDGGEGGPGAGAAAGARGADTAAAATSSQTSGLGKATSVVGTTPGIEDARSGLGTASASVAQNAPESVTGATFGRGR